MKLLSLKKSLISRQWEANHIWESTAFGWNIQFQKNSSSKHGLTHFWPIFPFYAPWKQQKNKGFGVFRGYEMETLGRNEFLNYVPGALMTLVLIKLFVRNITSFVMMLLSSALGKWMFLPSFFFYSHFS